MRAVTRFTVVALLGVLAATVLVAGCDVERSAGPLADSPQFEILDAAHNDGHSGFYFGYPVGFPDSMGTFDPSFHPVLAVEICEWDGLQCVLPLLERITSESSQSGAAPIRIKSDSSAFWTRWDTWNYDVDDGPTYRISVLADDIELGHFDVILTEDRSGFKDVNRDEFVALVENGRLPIIFRVEEACDLCDPNTCTLPNRNVCGTQNGIAFCSCNPGFVEDGQGDCVTPSAPSLAVTVVQITDSDDYDTSPRLGQDATSDLVVFTTNERLPDGSYAAGKISVQRLNPDGTTGHVIEVSDGATNDQLGDVSGGRIVYTAFDDLATLQGQIMLYDLGIGIPSALMAQAGTVREARIHDDIVVWTQGQAGSTEIEYLDLNWPSGTAPITIGGGAVPASNVDIGFRYVVWEQFVNGQTDIGAYDIFGGSYVSISNDPNLDEAEPSTFGQYIVWQSTDAAGNMTIEMADMSVKPAIRTTLVDNGAQVFAPSINGDYVTFESRLPGNLDIYVYRISDGMVFTLTSEPDDQHQNDVFGDKVTYVESDLGPDIKVSTFSIVP